MDLATEEAVGVNILDHLVALCKSSLRDWRSEVCHYEHQLPFYLLIYIGGCCEIPPEGSNASSHISSCFVQILRRPL
jgi:hypothetical protein